MRVFVNLPNLDFNLRNYGLFTIFASNIRKG